MCSAKKKSKLGIEAVIKHLIAVNTGDVRGDDTLIFGWNEFLDFAR